MRKGKNSPWALLIFMLCGLVIGGFIGMLTKDISWLSWLNYGQSFGLSSPIVLDLGVIVLTFGITISITMASIIGVAIALLIYRYL